MAKSKYAWANLKVGVVVLIGLGIFIFFVTVVGNDQNLFTSTYPLRLFMPNALGLVNGSEVTLGGLKVGFVNDLTFVSHDTVNGVNVLMEVDSKYRKTITTSTVAQIKTIGLLGDKYVDLTIGGSSEQPLADNALVPVRESFDIEAAGPQLKTALTDFTSLLGHMDRITASIEKGEGSAGKIIKDPALYNDAEHFLNSLNATVNAVQQQRGALGTMIYNKDLSNNLTELTANLRAVTGSLRQGKGTMGKLLMNDTLYTTLNSFTLRADSLLAKANSDSSNVSKLISDPKFYQHMMDVLNDLNLFLIDIKQNPGRYVHVSVF